MERTKSRQHVQIVDGGFLLDKNIIAGITMMVLLGITTVVMVEVYGDDIDERYYDVPFDCKEFIHEEETILGNKTTYLLDCKKLIEILTPPKITVIIDDCDEECKEVIKKAIECREADYTLEGCYGTGKIEPPADPDPDLPPEEKKLKEAQKRVDDFCADFRDTPQEIIACETYKTLKLCEQGVNESYPIQKHRFFLTTDFELSIWYFFNYRVGVDYVIGILQKAKLECQYQRDILEPIILGPRYQNIADANVNYTQPYHGDMALSDNIILPLRLTPSVHATTIKVAEDTRCSLIQFQSTWVDYGCKPAPIDDCYMPTEEQLTNIYNKIWQEEFRDTPIKEIFKEQYDTCMSKVASMELKEVGWYDDYINSTDPMVNYHNYFKNPITAKPIGIPKSGVPITGCGSTNGGCLLVLPSN